MNKTPYDKTQRVCAYGQFSSVPAGYTITDKDKLNGPWYYVYQNRKILLYVDQNGPVKIQYNPPSGILVCKREPSENQSKWQVWIQSKDLNNGVPVSNFATPILRYDLKRPICSVDWLPEKAIYRSEYDNFDIISEIFVPIDKATVCMKTTIVNKSDKDSDFTVVPSVYPFVYTPQVTAWDLPEWYLTTSAVKNGKVFCICGQMKDPSMDENKYHSVTFNLDFDKDAEFELNMSNFTRSGNFYAPVSVLDGMSFTYKMDNFQNALYSDRQAVWAAKYKACIKAGESKTFTQVITVQNAKKYDSNENIFEQNYFNEELYSEYKEKSKQFYADLFSKRSIKTGNDVYDNFINSFAPLQMYWVCSLDRGWPSSMRGTRDASQDFVGMNPIDPLWAKSTILQLLSHQRTDGWFPRQISTISREAPHDMRNFCDGGAFFLELAYEYLTYTRDVNLMGEKVYWLDSDQESTVLEHVIRCLDYYLNSQNIGEHGLCKAWYGDWWDVIDHVGSEGRGESVTVTAQMVLNLKYLIEILNWLKAQNKLEEKYFSLIDVCKQARENFATALKDSAYNSLGYFNGYFNDDGKWLFSDNDPDGEKRLYLVSNAWAIISGVADKEMRGSIIDNIEKLSFGRLGYNTNSLAFKKFVPKAGRVGNLSLTEDCPYNHAQSFLVRACCVAGDAKTAYKATRYILPIEQEYAPVEKTFAAPFCIANAYNSSDVNLHRVELQFLSGTVSYVLRTVYAYFFGITYGFDGLTIKHCLPKEFGNCSATFSYLGKNFILKFTKTEKSSTKFNGNKWNKVKFSEEYQKDFPFIADEDMKEQNIIEIEY